MDVRRGAKRAFPLEIGTKNQTFLEFLELTGKFGLIDLIVAFIVFLPP